MPVPAYFFILLGVILVCAAAVFAYVRLYKRHINRVLSAETQAPKALLPPYKLALIATAAVLVACAGLSFGAGYFKAYRQFESNAQAFLAADIRVFYAQVQSVSGRVLVLDGIELNEERYQGEFTYEVWGETCLVRRDAPITLADLSEGDLVAIVLLTDKAGVTDVFKIQVLT